MTCQNTILWSVLALTVCCAGCKKEDDSNSCIGEPSIVPGVGVRTASGQWCLGAPASAIEQAVGAAQAEEDLAAVGLRVAYPDHRLTALYGGDRALGLQSIYLDSGVGVQTSGGVGVGSTGADVRAEFGEPLVDPFLGTWWYRGRGIAFELVSDAVVRIQIFTPVTD
ncbi:MAG: hypothetical protein ABI333_23705 [bacterium]